jgi:hypothetical protein
MSDDTKQTVPRLTSEQATILAVVTGVLVLSPKLFRQNIEKRLQRKVELAEWANDDFVKYLQDLYREEFLAICCMDEPDLIVVPTLQ